MGYKTESNKQTNKTNKQKLKTADNSMVVARGKVGAGEVEGIGGINGDERRLDFEW